MLTCGGSEGPSQPVSFGLMLIFPMARISSSGSKLAALIGDPLDGLSQLRDLLHECRKMAFVEC